MTNPKQFHVPADQLTRTAILERLHARRAKAAASEGNGGDEGRSTKQVPDLMVGGLSGLSAMGGSRRVTEHGTRKTDALGAPDPKPEKRKMRP